MAGFWTRQFQLPGTPAQRRFDLIFGILAPVICVLLDPAIFRPFAGGAWFLRHLRLLAYLEMAISIAALTYYQLTNRASSFLAGALCGSAAFAFALGAVMFPMTLIGMLFLIGVLGLTPFFTSFVYLRNAIRCWRVCEARSSRPVGMMPAIFGFILILSAPAIAQKAVFHYGDRALMAVQSGPIEDFNRAVRTLKWLHYDTDEIAFTYQKTNDAARRDRLARAFIAITGETVQERLMQLND
jgi:hypothetical protein